MSPAPKGGRTASSCRRQIGARTKRLTRRHFRTGDLERERSNSTSGARTGSQTKAVVIEGRSAALAKVDTPTPSQGRGTAPATASKAEAKSRKMIAIAEAHLRAHKRSAELARAGTESRREITMAVE